MQNGKFLGAVPKSWSVGAFRYYVQVREGQVDPQAANVEDLTLIAPNHVEPRTGRLIAIETAAEQGAESGKYWCDAGDVIYSKIRPALRKVAMAPHDCLCSADMYPLKGRNGLSNRFLYWYLLSEQFSDFALRESARVAMPKLNRETLAAASVPVPSKDEQERIANFLDEQTKRVDALISEKERLVDVVNSLKFDAIDRAVLGDGTSRVGQRLKGLEALGPIPEGWTSSRMKFELEYVTSGSRGWAEHYADDGTLFVRIGNLTRDSIGLDLSDVQRVAIPDAAEGVRARVQPGDLLISITAYLGSVAVAPDDIEEAYVSQHVSLARPNCIRALQKWLGYVVLSSIGRTFFDLQAYGGTKVQLSLDDIRELPVPLPTAEVQRERINVLESRLRSLDKLAAHAQEHIERLREYRSSLISAAVTGQLNISTFDQREAA